LKNLDFSNDNYKEYKPEVFGDIMKMVFSVSPYGGCVNQAISIIEQKNTLKLLEEIKLRIDRLEECTKNTFVKNLYIKENFFYYALIKSKSCHYENQKERLAELVVNAMAEEVINIDDAEILIDIISEINTSEIELFKWISDSWYKSFVVENTKLFYYLPVLLISGVVTGALIGMLAGIIQKRIAKAKNYEF